MTPEKHTQYIKDLLLELDEYRTITRYLYRLLLPITFVKLKHNEEGTITSEISIQHEDYKKQKSLTHSLCIFLISERIYHPEIHRFFFSKFLKRLSPIEEIISQHDKWDDVIVLVPDSQFTDLLTCTELVSIDSYASLYGFEIRASDKRNIKICLKEEIE